MTKTSAKAVWLDLLSGVVAIVVVVGASMAVKAVGYDFRGIYALTATCFFLAGMARGNAPIGSLGWQAARVSVGGFLGIAALIVNNGPHRLSILAGLVLIAVALSSAGLLVRGRWQEGRRFSIRLGAFSLLGAALFVLFVVPMLSTFSAFETPGRPMQASFGLTAGDRIVQAESLRGRVVVLAFWASWCLPCLQELPELQPVYNRYRNDPGVAFFAVDTGWGGETPEKGQRRLAQRHLDLPMVFDSGAAAKAFGLDGIPALVLIDGNGAVRRIHRGYDRSERLEEALVREIERLRNEPNAK